MKKLLQFQALVLLGGTIFAWYTVYQDFSKFYAIEGSLLKVTDCVVSNPVTTPCFYGAFAFLFALIWSIYILRLTEDKLKAIHHKKLTWLLVASTIFAWSNFGYVLYKFLANSGQPTIGCSGQLMTNPFTTPCFIGSVIFLIALLVNLWLRRIFLRIQLVVR